MVLELITIACRSDNYAFLVHDDATGQTALFDAPEAEPILAALDQRGWSLDHIFITHHHGDHIEGVPGLLSRHQARVIGGEQDNHRLPALHLAVNPGDTVDFAGHEVRVMAADGHTVGHIAFHLPDANAVFTGDSLMALGCGRLFEGTPDQMWATLTGFMALPDDTLICSGHEYTAANARFALTIEPNNPDLIARAQEIETTRANGLFTVPSYLGVEMKTNPFLRAALPEVKTAVALKDAPDAEVFAAIRRAKDNF